MKVIRLCAVLFLLMLGGCTAWSPPKTASWSNATGVEAFERLWWKAIQQKDWSQVESHVASTYVAVLPGGTFERDAAVQQFKELQIDEFSLGEVVVEPSGDATIITYTMNLRGQRNGQPVELTGARMMSVWQQQKHGWVQIAHAER